MEIEKFDTLVEKLGRPIGDQLIQQFRAVLSKRVRLEDTVSQTGPAQFTVVCPGIGLDDARAFANRLDQTIRNATISYRGERVEIRLKFGFANSRDDEWQSMTHLLQLAEGRAVQEEEMAAEAIAPEVAAEPPLPGLGIEDAMALLHSGDTEGVKPHLAAIAAQLMPLLKLIDAELKLGMNPESAEEKLKRLD